MNQMNRQEIRIRPARPLPKLRSGTDWSVKVADKTILNGVGEADAWTAFTRASGVAELLKGNVVLAQRGFKGHRYVDAWMVAPDGKVDVA